jgi:hypothetical protein
MTSTIDYQRALICPWDRGRCPYAWYTPHPVASVPGVPCSSNAPTQDRRRAQEVERAGGLSRGRLGLALVCRLCPRTTRDPCRCSPNPCFTGQTYPYCSRRGLPPRVQLACRRATGSSEALNKYPYPSPPHRLPAEQPRVVPRQPAGTIVPGTISGNARKISSCPSGPTSRPDPHPTGQVRPVAKERARAVLHGSSRIRVGQVNVK